MTEVQAIIDASGGKLAVALACEVTAGAVEKWVAFARIPARHWPTIVRLAGGKVSWAALTGQPDPQSPSVESLGGSTVSARFLDWSTAGLPAAGFGAKHEDAA